MRRKMAKESAATKVAKVGKNGATVVSRFGSGLSVTTKGRYGLRFVIELARHIGNRALALHELGERLDISEKYLWHVARLLTSAELIRAERGAHGGYRLARLPETITLLEIVEALEGPCQLVPAAELGDGAAGFAWGEVETALRQKLQSLTLRGLIERYDAQTAGLHYVI